jgi:hypothetical protein
MLKSLLTLAAVGVAGFVAWKLVWVMLLPMVFGLLAVAIKIALIALLVYVLFKVFRRATEPGPRPVS